MSLFRVLLLSLAVGCTVAKNNTNVPTAPPNNVPYDPNYCPRCTTKDCRCSDSLDVLFVCDITGSIAQTDYRLYKTYLKNVIGGFNLGNDIKTAMITFRNGGAARQYNFSDSTSTNSSQICNVINNLPTTSGQTYTNKAIDLATAILSTETRGGQVCNSMVIVTDGGADNKTTLRIAMQNLYNTVPNTKICLVQVGDPLHGSGGRQMDVSYILGNGLTPPVNGNAELIDAADFQSINSIVTKTIDCLCNCRPPTPPPPPTPPSTPPPPPPSAPTTTQPPPDCHCQILADPVMNTCNGTLLVFEIANGPVLVFTTPAMGFCPAFELYAQADGDSLKLILSDSVGSRTILPDGSVFSNTANTGISGATTSSFTDGNFSGVQIVFSNCGVQIRFGKEGAHFAKADILLPGRIVESTVISGACVTNALQLPSK